MSYNIAESATLNAAASNLTIASDSYVSYTPDYKKLVIRGNGTNYGICYTGLTVDSGGFLDMGNRAYVSALTVLSGGTAVGAGWGAWRDITVSSGGSVTFLAAKLHGNFNIAKGAITNCASAYAVDGTFYDFDTDLSFDVFDGVGFSGGRFGGTLSMTSSTKLTDITVVNGGTVNVYVGAVANGITVEAGGKVNFITSSWYRPDLVGLVVSNGGSASAGGWCAWKSVDVKEGGKITADTAKIYGSNINIAQGAWTNYTNAYAVNGVIYGLDTVANGNGMDFFEGAVLSNGRLGGYTSLCYGAQARDVELATANRGIAIRSGCLGYNLSATVGNIYFEEYWNNVSLGGAATEIAAGHVFYNGAGNTTTTPDADLYATNGVLHNLTVKGSGSWMQNLTLVEGITADTPIVYGGTLTVGSGGNASGAVVSNTGSLYVTANGETRNAAVSAGGKMFVSSAGKAYDTVVENGGKLTVSVGAVASGVTVREGGTASYVVSSWYRPDVIGLVVENGGSAITENYVPWKSLDIQEGGHFSNTAGVKIYGTDINIASGAWVNCPTASVSGGMIQNYQGAQNFDVYEGAGFSAARLGGTVSMTSGTTITDATVTNGGTLNVSYGVGASGITVENGGKVNFIASSWYRPDLVGLVVSNGGVASADAWCAWKSVDVKEGGKISAGNAKIYGSDINIAQGAWANYAAAYAVNGVIYDLDTVATGNGMDFFEGAVLSNGRLGGYTSLCYGAQARDVELATANRGIAIRSGCLGYNLTATVGNIYLEEYWNNVSLGGAQTEIAAGHVYYNGAGNTTAPDADLYATNGVLYNLTVSGSGSWMQNLTLVEGITAEAPVVYGGKLNIGSAATVTDLVMSGGTALVLSGGVLDGVSQSAGLVRLESGATANTVAVDGGSFRVDSGATMTGASLNTGSLTVFESAVVSGFEQTGGRVIVYGTDAAIEGATVYGGNMSIGNGGALNDTTISGGTVVVRHVAGWAYSDNLTATASDVRIETGAGLTLESGGILEAGKLAAGADLTIYKGGKAGLTSAAAGAEVNISFWDVNAGHGNDEAIITDWGDFSPDAKVNVSSIETGYSYVIADTANANVTLNCGSYRTIFAESVRSGAQYSDAFLGRNLDFSDGMTLVVSSFGVDLATTAAKFSATTATSLADGGFAAIWNGDTAYAGGNLTIADANLNGNVWLTLNGFDQSAANIYGAEGAFDHDVNMWLYDGTVKNLAAGAKLGGSVENVNILISDTGENGMKITNAMYAGGMGDVTGEIEAIVYGGEFGGNVFAGALCNYVANNTATDTGAIGFTVNGGTFNNNIYAGAAVKAGAATSVVHTTGDITLTLNGGTATKGAFCVYGGGYATGTTEDALVYTAGDVDISIAGGAWGEYVSGRGIFGGVYADKIAASVGNVEISVTDGTLGNIYGGGWAQNGGTSTVGDVSITVTGSAEIANVFGGGSYSSVSGGSTSVDNVTIVVSGGTISGNIFAAGQGEFSTVTGNVSVEFSGSNDYSCNVYGYGVPTSATTSANKTLAFDGYTGTISGAIGGFDGIVLSGNTAATLTGAIDNDDWSFDYTDRTASAATAMLTLDDGELTGEVAVDLSSVAQAADGWNIAAGLDSAVAAFGVELSTGSASGLRLNDTLDSSYGIYEGWGFTLEESTLKFKQLA